MHSKTMIKLIYNTEAFEILLLFQHPFTNAVFIEFRFLNTLTFKYIKVVNVLTFKDDRKNKIYIRNTIFFKVPDLPFSPLIYRKFIAQ